MSVPTSYIGINIGPMTIKCAQMLKVADKFTLIGASSCRIEYEKFKNEEEATLEALRKVLLDFPAQGSTIVCTIENSETLTKQVLVPKMPKSELHEAIWWEFKDAVSYPLEEAVIDFETISEIALGDKFKLNILSVVSNQETIRSTLRMFSSLNLNVAALIPISLANQNLVQRTVSQEDKTIAVLMITEMSSELDIYKNAFFQFSRKLPYSGRLVTKSLTSPLATARGKIELSIEEAEKIKIECGIPAEDDKEIIEGKISKIQILSLMRPKLEKLATELQRSFDYFREETGEEVKKLIMLGKGARLKGLEKFLEKQLGVEIIFGYSVEDKNIEVDDKIKSVDILNQYVLSVGAILGEGKGINLLPKDMRNKKEMQMKKNFLKFGASVTLIVLLIINGVLMSNMMSQEKKLKAIHAQYKFLAPNMQELRSQVYLGEILYSNVDWSEIFKEISNIVPNEMYFTSVKVEKKLMNIKGIITKTDESAEMVLSNFILQMEEGLFNNVRLISTEKFKDKEFMTEFKIESEI